MATSPRFGSRAESAQYVSKAAHKMLFLQKHPKIGPIITNKTTHVIDLAAAPGGFTQVAQQAMLISSAVRHRVYWLEYAKRSGVKPSDPAYLITMRNFFAKQSCYLHIPPPQVISLDNVLDFPPPIMSFVEPEIYKTLTTRAQLSEILASGMPTAVTQGARVKDKAAEPTLTVEELEHDFRAQRKSVTMMVAMLKQAMTHKRKEHGMERRLHNLPWGGLSAAKLLVADMKSLRGEEKAVRSVAKSFQEDAEKIIQMPALVRAKWVKEGRSNDREIVILHDGVSVQRDTRESLLHSQAVMMITALRYALLIAHCCLTCPDGVGQTFLHTPGAQIQFRRGASYDRTPHRSVHSMKIVGRTRVPAFEPGVYISAVPPTATANVTFVTKALRSEYMNTVVERLRSLFESVEICHDTALNAYSSNVSKDHPVAGVSQVERAVAPRASGESLIQQSSSPECYIVCKRMLVPPISTVLNDRCDFFCLPAIFPRHRKVTNERYAWYCPGCHQHRMNPCVVCANEFFKRYPH